MKRILTGLFVSAMVVASTAAPAQTKPPLKLGGILDMSSLYADITGVGSETAAKMAAEDFGGQFAAGPGDVGIEAGHVENAAEFQRRLGLGQSCGGNGRGGGNGQP